MKLIMENWRKFLLEDTRAFHGYGMDPTKMRVDACDQGDKPSDPSNSPFCTDMFPQILIYYK